MAEKSSEGNQHIGQAGVNALQIACKCHADICSKTHTNGESVSFQNFITLPNVIPRVDYIL